MSDDKYLNIQQQQQQERQFYRPWSEFDIYSNDCSRPGSGLSRPSFLKGIQAQLTDSSEVLLDNCSPVLFDTVMNKTSSGIRYDCSTGTFTLTRNRNYYVSWSVAIDGTECTSFVEFAIAINSCPVSISSFPQVTCQLSGAALISINSAPDYLSLLNVSGNTIRYAPVSVQANIVIIELSS